MKKEKYIEEMKGRYRVRIRKNGKDYMRYFNFADYPSERLCLQSAIQHRDKVLYEMQIGKYTATASDKTFDDVYEEMKVLFPKSISTHNKFDILYNKHFYNLKDIPIAELSALDIIMCLNAMVETASDNTIQRCLSIVRQVIKTARIKKYILVDVTEEIIPPKSKYRVKKREPLANMDSVTRIIEEFESCKSNARTKHDRYMIAQAIKILLYTGIRPAECFALTRDNIDLKKGTLHVTGQLGSTTTANNVITPAKTALSDRVVPLTTQAIDVLKTVLEMHDNEFVFCKENGEHFDMLKVQQIINVHCKKNGYKFTLYQLRHTFSTDMLMSGVDPRTVQELMGHAHFSMTADYARSNLQAKKEAINNRKINGENHGKF